MASQCVSNVVFARRRTCITGLDSFCVGHRFRTSPRSPNHSRPRPSTRWLRPHLGTSLPLAPSDQFRTETAFLLVCDGDLVGLVLGRHVQILFSSAHPPRVASTCCARTASHLSACCWHCSFCHGSLGPNPGCSSFFTSIWHVFHHRKMSLSLWFAE